MLDWMWRRGWDEEYGGLFYFRDLRGLPVQDYWHDMKFWWPQCEAIIATQLAWTLTGDLYDVAIAAAAATDRRTAKEAPIAAGRGPLVLLARITGTLESPTYAADLEVGPGMVQARADLAPVENLRLRAHLGLEGAAFSCLGFEGFELGGRWKRGRLARR